ncbi:MAG: hypothetical protein AAB797_03945 [Patescibacteria group bacterium]
MNTVNAHKTGLVLGAFTGLLHLAWSLLVAIGWAQPLVDFISNLHFIQSPHTITPFQLLTALELVVVASMVGYIFGLVLAKIWNRVYTAS